jgi:tripeptidyl-peptidase-1
MLLQYLIAALTTGLAFEANANPLPEHVGSQVKRVAVSHSLHERHLPHWSNQWSKRSKVPHAQILPMRIGLKQSNLEAGHDRLMDMYLVPYT